MALEFGHLMWRPFAGVLMRGRIILMAAGALACPIAAVPGAASRPGAEQPAIEFTVFALRPIQGVGFVSQPDAVADPLTFYPTARSPLYVYRGTMPLVFSELNTGTTVASVNIPPEVRRPLLIWSSVDGGNIHAPAFRIHILDDDGDRLGAGGLTIINLSGLTLNGFVAGKPVTIGAGLNRGPPAGERASIELYADWKGRRLRSYFDTIPMGSGDRALLILFPPYYPGSLEVQGRLLVDIPPAPHAETKGL